MIVSPQIEQKIVFIQDTDYGKNKKYLLFLGLRAFLDIISADGAFQNAVLQ